uniref:Uncharacterized protein n=1 Tax=Salix viminalis TaxID=40686 RepID=A0A6N2MW22_SALVM
MSSRTENPKAAPPPSQFPEGQWSTGIFNCFDDPSNSCRLQGLVYYAMSHIGCAWLYGGVYRSKLRGFLSLPETPCAIGWSIVAAVYVLCLKSIESSKIVELIPP